MSLIFNLTQKMTSVDKGNCALGFALEYFSNHLWFICKPLDMRQGYTLAEEAESDFDAAAIELDNAEYEAELAVAYLTGSLRDK